MAAVRKVQRPRVYTPVGRLFTMKLHSSAGRALIQRAPRFDDRARLVRRPAVTFFSSLRSGFDNQHHQVQLKPNISPPLSSSCPHFFIFPPSPSSFVCFSAACTLCLPFPPTIESAVDPAGVKEEEEEAWLGVRQDIRIPARFSAVQLQSLLI